MHPVLEKPVAAHLRTPSYVQLPWGTRREDRPETRILISFDSGYRVYRDVIAGAIEVMRPEAEVITTDLERLDEEVRSLGPDLVICGRMGGGGRPPPSVPAWVELPLTPTRPATVYLRGKRSEKSNPTLDVLLEIIDEVRKSSRKEE